MLDQRQSQAPAKDRTAAPRQKRQRACVPPVQPRPNGSATTARSGLAAAWAKQFAMETPS